MSIPSNQEQSVSALRLAQQALPSIFLLTMATFFSQSSFAADPSLGTPLFAQTVNNHSRVSEGYASPVDLLSRAPAAQTQNRLSQHLDIWVSDVTTEIFNDSDQDGYFAGFSVVLDVDVSWESADVFANIYLQSRGDSPDLLHSTNVFGIYEQEQADSYRVVVDLTDNVRADHYDLIIDVVDAYTGEVADTVSHRTHSNLSRLPLESNNHQYVEPYFNGNNSQVVTTFTLGVSSNSTTYNDNQNFSGVGFGVSTTFTDYRGGTGLIMLMILASFGALRATPVSSSVYSVFVNHRARDGGQGDSNGAVSRHLRSGQKRSFGLLAKSGQGCAMVNLSNRWRKHR